MNTYDCPECGGQTEEVTEKFELNEIAVGPYLINKCWTCHEILLDKEVVIKAEQEYFRLSRDITCLKRPDKGC